MTDDINPQSNVPDLDLRKLVGIFIKRWKLIVIFSILGGLIGVAIFLFAKPYYTATAVVAIDPLSLASNTTPIYLIQSESVREKVLEKLDISSNQLPEMAFTIDKNDKTVVTISAISPDAQSAIKAADAWAESAVILAVEAKNKLGVKAEKARTDLEAIDIELSLYLSRTGLTSLSWVELVAITGAGDSSSMAIMESSRELPQISISDRNEISKIIRRKNLAQWNYTELSRRYLTQANASQSGIVLLNHATKAYQNNGVFHKLVIPLGVFLGLFIALFYSLIEDWWKSSSTGVEPLATK